MFMKRALFLIAVLGLFSAAITGCRASAEVEGKDSASITLPR
jgi:predicted small secreted protein